jgi:hypothetical protein
MTIANWDALISSLEGIEIITDHSQVANLHARSVDTSITYLQSIFPSDRSLQLIKHMYHHFGDQVMIHVLQAK